MIESTPEKTPETEPDAPGAPEEREPEGSVTPATDDTGNTVLDDVEEDGVALHVVDPHEPGTILVAVAEPADMQSSVQAHPGEVIPRFGDLVDIAAVRMEGLGPALFFTTGGMACVPGDKVIVEMEEGHAFGVVASVLQMAPAHLEDSSGEGGGGKVRALVRIATEKDIAAAEANRNLALEALEYCSDCVRDRRLDMKLVDVLILHDRSKMVFYFSAPARIDFRELVKDLVRRYRTRIELRQIGVRHETQMVGALGNCGMVCCCRRYLRKFAPVAIKMAKEQNVFLNPVKISGICGRLLCCLAYEQEHYDEFYRSCPKLGKKYHTDAGVFRVLRASLFRESISVLSDTGEEVEYPLSEWNALNPNRPNAPQQQQGLRKQEAQGGDGRQRKSAGGTRPSRFPQQGGRDPEKPADMREQGYGHGHARPVAVIAPAAVIVTEERSLVVEDGDSLTVTESSSVSAVLTENVQADAVAEDGIDDAAGDANDDAAGDANDDANDDGGSIFGLAPRRDASRSGPQSREEGGNAETRDGGNRRKRPRRRKPHSSE